jgi:hypothetical protein
MRNSNRFVVRAEFASFHHDDQVASPYLASGIECSQRAQDE